MMDHTHPAPRAFPLDFHLTMTLRRTFPSASLASEFAAAIGEAAGAETDAEVEIRGTHYPRISDGHTADPRWEALRQATGQILGSVATGFAQAEMQQAQPQTILTTTEQAGMDDTAGIEPTESPASAPAKRTRRTKAEMEAARASSASTSPGTGPSTSESTELADPPFDEASAADAADAEAASGQPATGATTASSSTSPPPAPATTPSATTSDAPTVEAVRAAAQAAMKRHSDNRAKLGVLLKTYEAESISSVAEEKRAAFLESVVAL